MFYFWTVFPSILWCIQRFEDFLLGSTSSLLGSQASNIRSHRSLHWCPFFNGCLMSGGGSLIFHSQGAGQPLGQKNPRWFLRRWTIGILKHSQFLGRNCLFCSSRMQKGMTGWQGSFYCPCLVWIWWLQVEQIIGMTRPPTSCECLIEVGLFFSLWKDQFNRISIAPGVGATNSFYDSFRTCGPGVQEVRSASEPTQQIGLSEWQTPKFHVPWFLIFPVKAAGTPPIFRHTHIQSHTMWI